MPIYFDATGTYRLTETDFSDFPITIPNFESIVENIIDHAENVRLVEKNFAELFYEIFKNYFFFSKGTAWEWYMFKKHRWYHKTRNLIADTITINIRSFCRHYSSLIVKKQQELQKTKEEGKIIDTSYFEERFQKLQLNVNRISSVGFINEIYRQIEEKFYNPLIASLLDTKPLLCFENGVLDLKACIFRDGRREDYCTHSCYFNFEEEKDPIKLNKLNSFLDGLFPNVEMKENFLTQMCYTVFGSYLKSNPRDPVSEFKKTHIPAIFAGDEGAGLMILNRFIEICFGDYVAHISSNSTKKEIHHKMYGVSPSLHDLFKNKKILFLGEMNQDLESLFEIAGEFLDDDVRFFISGRKSYFDSYSDQEKLKKFPRIDVVSKPTPDYDINYGLNELQCAFITVILKQRFKILG